MDEVQNVKRSLHILPGSPRRTVKTELMGEMQMASLSCRHHFVQLARNDKSKQKKSSSVATLLPFYSWLVVVVSCGSFSCHPGLIHIFPGHISPLILILNGIFSRWTPACLDQHRSCCGARLRVTEVCCRPRRVTYRCIVNRNRRAGVHQVCVSRSADR